jgi:pyridoxine 5-phosphate synthase
VSLFVDPNAEQIMAAKEVGSDYVEIHTGHYSNARNHQEEDREFEKIMKGVATASRLGLGVNAGHGIDYSNIMRLTTLQEIEEFSIGHSIIARSVLVGIERAVREMLNLINTAKGGIDKSAKDLVPNS